jgi:hypothetical protein
VTNDKEATPFDDGNLRVDFARQEVTFGGRTADLNPKEYLVPPRSSIKESPFLFCR